MKEEFKITGHGSLHDKKFGNIKIDDKKQQFKSKIMYDNKTDQYCINGQWEIPFHTSERKVDIDSKLKKIILEIKEIKSELVKNQKYELAADLRDIEKSIVGIMNKNKIK